MIPALTVLIAFYVLTRMAEILDGPDGNGRSVRVVAVLTSLVAIVVAVYVVYLGAQVDVALSTALPPPAWETLGY
jgi:hypothetical protein